MMRRLPFVRMAAITGALAMDNEDGRDIDYFIVTEAGRVWLCRGLVILLVRWAAYSGDVICPNFFLSEKALHLQERNLFTAHELAQMRPLFGLEVYRKIRRLNAWTAEFLPNAGQAPPPDLHKAEPASRLAMQAAAEALLRTRLGGWVEAWEMERKMRKLNALRQPSAEADFCAEWCKGHFGGYGGRTLAAYADRLQRLEAAFP
jgi:hypothetical protein